MWAEEWFCRLAKPKPWASSPSSSSPSPFGDFQLLIIRRPTDGVRGNEFVCWQTFISLCLGCLLEGPRLSVLVNDTALSALGAGRGHGAWA